MKFTANICRSANEAEQGATLVEFCLASLFFLFMMGFFLDIGIGIHNYMLLTHVTEESARQAAVSLNSRMDCSAIEPYLNGTATTFIRDTLGADGTPRWAMRWKHTRRLQSGELSGEGGSFPVMEITSFFPVQCYFLCHMFPGGFVISSSSEVVIERSGADCSKFEFGHTPSERNDTSG